MKKIVLLSIVATLLLTFQVNAQTPTDTPTKHEVNLGVGAISTNQILDFMANVIVTTITWTAVHPQNLHYTATWHAGYKYSLSERWAVGPEFVYDGSTSELIVTGNKQGNLSNNYYTLAAAVDFKIVNKDAFKLYSAVGIGGTLFHQVYTPVTGEKTNATVPYFNFQFTPIGLKFGKTFGGYTELGVGYKGIINAGLFYRF